MKNAIRNTLSRPSLQPLLLKLLKLCHAGLNYGGGQSVENSGELGALDFARKALRNAEAPFTLFDVGANDGAYASCALRTLGERSRVYSFEPQSASFDALRARFADDSRVTLRRVALGKTSDPAPLYFGAGGETTATLNRKTDAAQSSSEMVAVSTVDEVCSTEGIERIHFLKIDTEGCEMEVLLGAADMLEQNRIDAIQFEFGDTFLHTPYHFMDFWMLLSPKFKMYRILRRGVFAVDGYAPDLEIYKIANFLCVRH
jgi:FkbM family methyltransferase